MAPRQTTSIKADPDKWKTYKIEAIKRNVDLSELVEMALDEYIKKHPLKEG